MFEYSAMSFSVLLLLEDEQYFDIDFTEIPFKVELSYTENYTPRELTVGLALVDKYGMRIE